MNSKIKKIISLIFSTRRLLHERSRECNCKLLPILQMETLRFVIDHHKANMRQLADYLNIRPPSATSLINDLEKGGLISRIYDKKDRRSVKLAVTDEGKAAVGAAMAKMIKKMSERLKNLDEEEQDSLIKILKKII